MKLRCTSLLVLTAAAVLFFPRLSTGQSEGQGTRSNLPHPFDTTCLLSRNADSALNLNLNLQNPYLANRAIHSDIAYFPQFFGPVAGKKVVGVNSEEAPDSIIVSPETPRWKYWMIMTPYPLTDETYENPTMRVSNYRDSGWVRPYAIGRRIIKGEIEDDTVWIPEPISRFVGPRESGHNADPELRYDRQRRQLQVIFMNYFRKSEKGSIIAFCSDDGITWDTGDTILLAASHPAVTDPWSGWSLVSPTAVGDTGRSFFLWFVDGISREKGSQIVRLTFPEMGRAWARADTCRIPAPFPDRQIWHIKIRRSPFDSLYYLLATLNQPLYPTVDTMGQFLYISRTGLDWLLVGEAIRHGGRKDWDFMTYRSTFIFEELDGNWDIPVWYTGATERSHGLEWGIAFTTLHLGRKRGDITGDCLIDSLDIIQLVNFLYSHGATLAEAETADVNCDGKIDLIDVIFILTTCYRN